MSAAISAAHQVDSTAMVETYYTSMATSMCGIVPNAIGAQVAASSGERQGDAGEGAPASLSVADFHKLLLDLHEQQQQCNRLPDQVQHQCAGHAMHVCLCITGRHACLDLT